MSKVRTCLWFDSGGWEAARFYVSLLPGSRIETPEPAESKFPPVVNFILGGAPYQILNGGPHYKLTPAASISASTEDQAETDRLWDALVDGGAPSRCGWLTDRFGVSWQIVPRRLPEIAGRRAGTKGDAGPDGHGKDRHRRAGAGGHDMSAHPHLLSLQGRNVTRRAKQKCHSGGADARRCRANRLLARLLLARMSDRALRQSAL